MHAVARRSSRSSLVVALLAFASAASAASAVGVDPAEEVRLRAGILRGEDDRDASDPGLRSALDSRSAVLRARAVRALGRIGDASTVPLVRRALVDVSQDVQREAVFALGEIESPDGIDALGRALGSKDPEQRARAAEALAKIASANAPVRESCGSRVVRRVLAVGTEQDDAVVVRALDSCWRFGAKTPGLVDAVGAAFLRQSPPVSEAAAYAASRLADRKFSSLFELASRDARPAVRAHAARGFGRLARLPGPESDTTPEARAILVRRGLDMDPLVRIAAFWALEAFPADARMADEMLAPSLASDDHGVKRAALSLVEAWGIGSDAKTLDRMARGADLDVQVDAVAALAAVAGKDAMPTIEELAQSKMWMRRAAAAEALGTKGFPLDAARPVLDKLLVDDDVRVVSAALTAAVADKHPNAAVLALAHLEAKDVVLRATAAEALPGLVGKDMTQGEAATALRRAWREGARDVSPDARLAVLDALVKLQEQDARPDVAAAMSDASYAVRLHARQLMKDDGISPLPSAGVVGIGRPMAFYTDAARTEMEAPRQRLRLVTDRGVVDVNLLPAEAVLTVRQMAGLARSGFLDGLTFHRVVPGFVAQGGDPRGDGWGGPSGSLRCEISPLHYDRGTAGMALSGKDTGGSQFFLTLTEQPHLDGGYTIFGTVAPESLAVLDRIQRFDVIRHASVVDAPPATEQVAVAAEPGAAQRTSYER